MGEQRRIVRGSTGRRTAPQARLPGTYLVWLGGALASQFGDAAMGFAVGWAAAAHGGPAAGLVLAAGSLPQLLLLLAGGVVGDRLGARRVMIAADAVMIVVALALVVGVHSWGTPFWLLLAASLVRGVVASFYQPSAGSMPRRLVSDDALPRALALRQGLSQTVSMLAAPCAGVLVGMGGLGLVAWLDAATFVVVLVVLVAIRPRYGPTPRSSDQSLMREALDGLAVVRRTPGLAAALVLVGGAAAFVLPTGPLLVPLLARDAAWSASMTGFVVGAQGFGIVVAALVVAATRRSEPRSSKNRDRGAARPAVAACAGLGIAALGQVVLALAPHLAGPWLAVAAGAVIGVGTGLFTAFLAPVVLGSAPRTHLARVQALVALVQVGGVFVANPLLGLVAGASSAGTALLLCGVGLAACALVGARSLRGVPD